VVDDDVADMDADAKLNPPFVWHVGVSLGHTPLHIDSTTHRIHYAAELSQQPVTGVLDYSPTMLGDLRID
jgi:hypothetical protein